MSKLDIDFIKWKVSYADGFEWFDGDIKWSEYSYSTPKTFVNDVKLYPLLLQRAIEGINIEAKYHINIGYRVDKKYNSSAYMCKPPFKGKDYVFDNIDEAKTQALKYIYNEVSNA